MLFVLVCELCFCLQNVCVVVVMFCVVLYVALSCVCGVFVCFVCDFTPDVVCVLRLCFFWFGVRLCVL